MSKVSISYDRINRQADHSVAALINLERGYVATVDALYPKYRADCNRNASLYTAEALENQRKEAKKEYSAQLLNTFNALLGDVGVEIDLMRDALAAWVSEAGGSRYRARAGLEYLALACMSRSTTAHAKVRKTLATHIRKAVHIHTATTSIPIMLVNIRITTTNIFTILTGTPSTNILTTPANISIIPTKTPTILTDILRKI